MPTILNCSHLVIATDDVPRAMRDFAWMFEAAPHFENDLFGEFVLSSRFRVAFFKPVGASAKFFRSGGERGHASFGVTVRDIEALHARVTSGDGIARGLTVSGPPKEHPWGEKSFLLVDADGNRWEITESPSADGMLVNR